MLIDKLTGGFLFDKSDDSGAAGSEADNTPPESDSQDSPGEYDDPAKYIEALEKRLAERDAKLQKQREALSELETLREARKKQLEEQGNYKALHESAQSKLAELEPIAQSYEQLINEIRDANEARIKSLPAEQQGLVKALSEKLSPPELRKWLDNAEGTIIGKRKAPDTGAGRGVEGGSPSIEITEQDRQASELAKSQGFNTTPEAIARRRKQLGQ